MEERKVKRDKRGRCGVRVGGGGEKANACVEERRAVGFLVFFF